MNRTSILQQKLILRLLLFSLACVKALAGSTIVAPGQVVAFGTDYYGYGTLNVPSSSDVIAVSAGGVHGLALRTNGTVLTWGSTNSSLLHVPDSVTNVVAIATTKDSSMALRADGTVVAWGNTATPGWTNVAAISGGHDFFLGLRQDGAVLRTGGPALPAGLTNLIAVSAGLAHGLGLREDGTLVTWGQDTTNQLAIPPGLSGVTAIAAGWHHSVALKSDRTVVVWGFETGSGVTSPPNGLSNVAAIAAGAYWTAAVRADGSCITWPGVAGVSELCGIVGISLSDSFGLAVGGPVSGAPLISTPESHNVTAGASVTFSVCVTGPQPITMQWQHDGRNLSGERQATLFLSNVQSNQAGHYCLVASNSGGTATSAVALLNILSSPKFKVSNLFDSGFGSLRSAILDANLSGGGLIYFHAAKGTISLTSPLPSLSGNVALVGPGTNLLILGGSLDVLSGSTSSVAGLTVKRIENAGDLMLSNSLVTGGTITSGYASVSGGGIFNSGTLRVYNSTIAGNYGQGPNAGSAGDLNGQPGYGGGIYVASGSVSIFNSLLLSNTVSGGSGACACCGQNPSCGRGANGYGGGIFLQTGRLEIFNSTLFGNRSLGPGAYQIMYPFGSCTSPADGLGGGIYINSGTALLVNSTLSGNYAMGGNGGCRTSGGANAYGGGIYLNGGQLSLINCTIVTNRVQGGFDGRGQPSGYPIGGGIYNSAGSINVLNTILAGNTYGDLVGSFVNQGYNILGANPLIGPLQDNGGPTFTHALLAGSPAIDAGTNSGFATDQRGQPRRVDNPAITNAVAGDGTDIGAVEVDHNLRMTEARKSDSNILVRFTSVSDKSYGLQFKPGGTNEVWINLPDRVSGSGAIVTITNAPGNASQRSYRAFEAP